jgi:endonuclease III
MDSTLRSESIADATRLRAILKKLAQAYGSPRWNPNHDPLGELVATILSQNTSDVNSDRAYAALRAAYGSWDAVEQANPDDLATTIRSGGLGRLKSRRIQEILRALKACQGHLNLDFLMDMPMPAARAFLAEFPGVGPKTVACVLLFACGHPAFPVDTHIVLEPLIPPAQIYRAHVNLIHHGRTVCTARRPDCEQCCLRPGCPYPQASTNTGTVGRKASPKTLTSDIP